MKAATCHARSWDELVRLEARVKADGGEVWEAKGTDCWFPPGMATTPTTANTRRIRAAAQIITVRV